MLDADTTLIREDAGQARTDREWLVCKFSRARSRIVSDLVERIETDWFYSNDTNWGMGRGQRYMRSFFLQPICSDSLGAT